MFDRPILVYSDYCIYSKQFLQLLMKHKALFDSFIRLNIDIDSRTKQRPAAFYKLQKQLNTNITKVPTIIVKNKQDELYILSDKDAFKWLDFETREKIKGDISGFNKNEMDSFSDKYSKYGSTDLNDATEQNFRFFRTDNGKILLQNDDLGCIEENDEDVKNKTKKETEEKFTREKFRNTTPNQGGPVAASQMIDFTNSSFGLAGKLNDTNTRIDKSKDIDKRLQQLMNERNNF